MSDVVNNYEQQLADDGRPPNGNAGHDFEVVGPVFALPPGVDNQEALAKLFAENGWIPVA